MDAPRSLTQGSTLKLRSGSGERWMSCRSVAAVLSSHAMTSHFLKFKLMPMYSNSATATAMAR